MTRRSIKSLKRKLSAKKQSSDTPKQVADDENTRESQASTAAPPPPALSPPASGRTTLYILMLNLLYPAVLGTIFYTFLQMIFQFGWLSNAEETKKLIYALGIVCHYHIDFLYVFSFEVYGWFAFCVDLSVVVLLYYAFAALTSTPVPNYRGIFGCFLAIYLIFFPHELIILRRYRKEMNRQLVRAHIWMLIHEGFSCILFVLCLLRPDIAASPFGAAILIAISIDYALILHARTKHKRII